MREAFRTNVGVGAGGYFGAPRVFGFPGRRSAHPAFGQAAAKVGEPLAKCPLTQRRIPTRATLSGAYSKWPDLGKSRKQDDHRS